MGNFLKKLLSCGNDWDDLVAQARCRLSDRREMAGRQTLYIDIAIEWLPLLEAEIKEQIPLGTAASFQQAAQLASQRHTELKGELIKKLNDIGCETSEEIATRAITSYTSRGLRR